jgi:predicted O-methyltransferase YrrM
MSQEKWTAVDRYIEDALGLSDPVLEAAVAAAKAAGLPEIQVAPNQGKLLWLLARARGARRILELGTLGGYSAIWLARALPPGGRLVTLELDPKHAEVARANLERAGLASLVDLRVGPALETLPKLAAEGAGPFELVFVDADKAAMPQYCEWALKLSAPGAVLVFDNVVRQGGLLDDSGSNPSVEGVRRLHGMLAADPRVSATTIQTVGCKGWDGLTIAYVTT